MNKNKYLSKAKRMDNNEWVEGYLFQTKEHTYIAYDGQYDDDLFLSPQNIFVEVDPNTICRYINQHVKDEIIIWENDIVNVHLFLEIAEGYGEHIREQGILCYDKMGILSLNVGSGDASCYSDIRYSDILFQAELAGIDIDIEVIGNVFDNPELLKKNNKEDLSQDDEEIEFE